MSVKKGSLQATQLQVSSLLKHLIATNVLIAQQRDIKCMKTLFFEGTSPICLATYVISGYGVAA